MEKKLSFLLSWLNDEVTSDDSELLLGETEVHTSCGEKSCGDWRSENGHAAHL
jgi:hypothetical protein